MPRSTVSLAALYSLLRPPRAPLAACMIFFFRAWCATPLLTRGMVRSLRLEETVDARIVGGAHQVRLLQLVLPLARLLGEDVAVVGVPTLQLSRTGPLEPLHGGALGLLLGHLFVLYLDDVLLLLCRPRGLRLFEPELPVVHDLDDGGPCRRCHFHEVQPALLGGGQRL